MITIKNIGVSYAMQPHVLKDCNATIEGPSITGIIGPNGAGKSTLLKAILGLIQSSGEILIDGEPTKKVLQKIAYVEQKSQIDFTFPITIRECVALGRTVKKKPLQRLTKEDWEKVDAAIEEVGLTDLASRQIGALSGGQFQRVLLARCMVQEAQYIFLDEPFVGIDMLSEKVIMTIIRKWKEEGKTILMVNHDLSKVKEYFDQVILVKHAIVASGKTEDVFIKKYLDDVYGGSVYIPQGGEQHA
ncbi:metal ABC transporter ATP-binding protein [Granulicatella adiacens ATCC 49175]|uniref:metal ABC transporter ATP-binding protein n=1 Tax=Granulicatella adiacens TaxID=46124 RepID=UPI00030BE94E|nr:metal ABC transporter ATP-binding protein [Granulicatella adiacens]UAK94253.1 metal ABC transporter ATP-binding protein [Granulicatella adiacens]UWP38509.1 metal ABC transporter ATP-binding protein [Granulicatella adiacens ATCC 49175]